MNQKRLLSNDKSTDLLSTQTSTKPQEVLKNKCTKGTVTFSKNPSKTERSKGNKGVNFLESHDFVFNLTENHNRFSSSIPGHLLQDSQTIKKLNILRKQ